MRTLYVVVAVDMHFFVWPANYAERTGCKAMTCEMARDEAYAECARLEQELNS